MNKLLLLLSFGFFCYEVYSQEHSIGQYTTIYSDQFLDIEAAEGVFTDASTNKSHQRYFLKYTNKTSDDITFSFVRFTEPPISSMKSYSSRFVLITPSLFPNPSR